MIHRWLIDIQSFDAMFISSLALAGLHYGGPTWLVFILYPMLASSIFTIIKGVGTWFETVANATVFLGKCVRDRTHVVTLDGHVKHTKVD